MTRINQIMSANVGVVLVLHVCFLAFLITDCECNRDEFLLLRDLLTEYDPAARPVKNISEQVVVRMGVTLFQIRDLDEKNQFLQVNAWFQFHWTDPHLTWNASSYGQVLNVRIPTSRIWIPDIVLYNSVDETKPATEVFPPTNAIVSSNGDVLWVVPAMIKSSCKIDITYFPFDIQHCPLKFGSWTYDGLKLDLMTLSDTGDLSKYIESGEWKLRGMPAQRNVEHYPCCVEPYVDVTYTINIRRLPKFFTYNLVFPCVLLMGIGILVFCLPPESGEKVSLGVTVLLAMTVYQLLIADAIPPTSEVIPLIGQFFGATIFLLSLSSAMTVLIMKLHFSGEHGAKVPRWIRTVVLVCLAKVVRMHKTTEQTYKMREKIQQLQETIDSNEGQFYNPHPRDYGGDNTGGGDISLLNHNSSRKEETSNCNILLNSIVNNDSYGDRYSEARYNDPRQSDTRFIENRYSDRSHYERTYSSSDYRCNDHRGGSSRSSGRNIGRPLNRRPENRHPEPHDFTDTNSILCELLLHVKQLNEEIHQRHMVADTDEHYKSEWRMVALVLDRILLILFFCITLFTATVIFVNVPPD